MNNDETLPDYIYILMSLIIFFPVSINPLICYTYVTSMFIINFIYKRQETVCSFPNNSMVPVVWKNTKSFIFLIHWVGEITYLKLNNGQDV